MDKHLDPWYITGLFDGEGSFISWYERDLVNQYPATWIQIVLRADDFRVLERVRETMGVGKVYVRGRGMGAGNPKATYIAGSAKDKAKWINHFREFPPMGKKRAEWPLWESISLRAGKIPAEGRKLSDQIRYVRAFRSDKPSTISLLNPWYVTGLSDAESCFVARCLKTGLNQSFKITMRSDDAGIVNSVASFFGVGSVAFRKAYGHSNPTVNYIAGKRSEIAVISDHFLSHPLQAKKANDFKLWSVMVDSLAAPARTRRPNGTFEKSSHPIEGRISEIASMVESLKTSRKYTGGMS